MIYVCVNVMAKVSTLSVDRGSRRRDGRLHLPPVAIRLPDVQVAELALPQVRLEHGPELVHVRVAVRHLKSGVDVMIAIFCDFCQLSAKKVAYFSKTNVKN
jgi:hypothetical protein